MNQFDHQWQKLTALARSAPVDPGAAPYGFATRLAAQATALPLRASWFSLEHLALRGLMVAAAFSVGAVTFNYVSAPSTDQSDAYAAGTAPIDEMLDLS